MTDTSQKRFNKMQEALDDIKRRIAEIGARRFGWSLPLQEVELREDAIEARLEEAARVDAQKRLAEFREAVILDEFAKHAFSDDLSEREIAFEVDTLLAPMKGEAAALFLEDVAFAPLLEKDILKGQMLQWLRDYRPFPRR